MEQYVIDRLVTESLTELQLVKRTKFNFSKLLSKCNPYELAVNCKTINDIVNYVLNKHKQTSSETIWGNYLESIAVKVSGIVLNGFKSKEVSTDIEWSENKKKHFIGWKSSPKWANSDQKRAVNNTQNQMSNMEDFGSFKVLTSYGKTSKRKNSNKFVQLSGQDAWQEISNDEDLYNKIMIAVNKNADTIGLFLNGIYISDMKKSIDWVKDNFENNDGTINFIKINKYVSSRDKITVTKW